MVFRTHIDSEALRLIQGADVACTKLSQLTDFIRDAVSQYENVSLTNQELEDKKSELASDLRKARSELRTSGRVKVQL